MRRLVALAAFLFVTAAADAQPGVTRPSEPQRERLAATGFERVGYRWGDGAGPDSSLRRASTLTTRGGVAVTRTLVYPPVDADEDAAVMRTIRVERSGRVLATWTDEVTGAWIEGYDVLSGDLDGDGAGEIVVVEHVGTGNGLGVATWEVFVVPETGIPDGGPMRMLVSDYGPTGLVQRVAPGGRGLRLVASSWDDGTEAGRGPGRGPGLYYTARFYRYDGGALVPDGPIRQRRYLNSFQRLRGREYEAGRYAPDRWLTRGVRTMTSEPSIPARPPEGRERVTAGPFEAFGGYQIAGREATAATLGDEATRRFFPVGYAPLGQPRTWPAGQAAWLETLPNPYPESEPARVLWLSR